MTDLPDDYMDNPTKYDQSIETLAGSPAGPDILRESQANATELEQLQIENKLLRDKYNLHDPEDSREQLFKEQIDQEVYERQLWVGSEEGTEALRDGVIQEWATEPRGQDSHSAYVETYEQRQRREAQEAESSE